MRVTVFALDFCHTEGGVAMVLIDGFRVRRAGILRWERRLCLARFEDSRVGQGSAPSEGSYESELLADGNALVLAA